MNDCSRVDFGLKKNFTHLFFQTMQINFIRYIAASLKSGK